MYGVTLTWEVPASGLVKVAQLVVGGQDEKDLGRHNSNCCRIVK